MKSNKNNSLDNVPFEEIVALSVYKGNARKIPMTKSRFKKEIKGAFNSGINQACEHILKSHVKNTYKTVDELIGDIQIYMSYNFNLLFK